MGAKTALLVVADTDLRSVLRRAVTPDPDLTAEVVAQSYEGYVVEPLGPVVLMDAVYPPPGMVYAAVWEGISLFCDRDLMLHHLPSALTDDLAEEPTVPGRRVLLHAMYSVTDRLAFAVWEDAMLRRSLSVAPDDGVIENLGKPFDFEEPFWAGRRPVPPDEDDPRPYPLPFHPLDLGEEALRSLFGFCLECRLGPDDVDPERITVHGFRVTDPAPRTEPARRDSLSAARVVRFDADGTLIIVEDD